MELDQSKPVMSWLEPLTLILCLSLSCVRALMLPVFSWHQRQQQHSNENDLYTYINIKTQLDLCMVMPLASRLEQKKTTNEVKLCVQVFYASPAARLSSWLDKGWISHNNPIVITYMAVCFFSKMQLCVCVNIVSKWEVEGKEHGTKYTLVRCMGGWRMREHVTYMAKGTNG